MLIKLRTLGLGLDVTATAGIASLVVGGCGFAYKDYEYMKSVRMMNRNKKENKKMLTDEAVDNLFRTLYYKEISNGDEFIQGLWRRVSPSMMQMLKTIGLEECETVMIQKRSNL